MGLCGVQRQQVPLIFQQNHTFLCDAACRESMLLSGKRAVWTIGIHCGTERETQNSAYLFIQYLFVNLFVLEFCQKWFGQEIFVVSVAPAPSQSIGPGSHLHVEAIVCSLIGVMGSAPVRYDNTVETPVSFQNIIEQILVVAAELIFVFVISPHDRPGTTFLYGSLECGQIDFMQCTIIDNYIDILAIDLLIVQSEMFDTGRYAIALHSVDIRNHHNGGEIWVLSHILKVTAIEGRAVNIDTGSEQNGFIAVAGLLSNGLTVSISHVRVPGGSQTG